MHNNLQVPKKQNTKEIINIIINNAMASIDMKKKKSTTYQHQQRETHFNTIIFFHFFITFSSHPKTLMYFYNMLITLQLNILKLLNSYRFT